MCLSDDLPIRLVIVCLAVNCSTILAQPMHVYKQKDRKASHLKGVEWMIQQVRGTITNIEQYPDYSILTVKTDTGDLVFIRYSQGTVGYSPILGERYEISYRVVENTLVALEVAKPFTPTYSSQRMEGPELVGEFTGAESDTDYERRMRSEGVRPTGISFIVVIFILGGLFLGLIGSLFLLLPAFLGHIGILFVSAAGIAGVLSYGLWQYKSWARLGAIIAGALISLTIVGAILGIPIIIYMLQDKIKELYTE